MYTINVCGWDGVTWESIECPEIEEDRAIALAEEVWESYNGHETVKLIFEDDGAVIWVKNEV